MIGRLALALQGAVPSGVYQAPQGIQPQHLYEVADVARWTFHYLDGAADGTACTDKATFLAQMGETFRFPSYAGQNWDAFEELMRDLSWLPQTGRLFVYDRPDVLARRQADSWRMARAILSDAADHWQQTPTPLIVLLRGAGRAGAGLPWL